MLISGMGVSRLLGRGVEFGRNAGLGLIPGDVIAIPEDLGVKVPHMGWDLNTVNQNDPVAAGFDQESTYFVHSFYVKTAPENILATCDYGVTLPSIVRRDNVIGMQFHPEKSGQIGLNGLRAFKEVIENANYSSN